MSRMDATNTNLIDPIAMVRQLDAKTIRQRLDDLDRERDALKVLLRAALRAEKPAVPGSLKKAVALATAPNVEGGHG